MRTSIPLSLILFAGALLTGILAGCESSSPAVKEVAVKNNKHKLVLIDVENNVHVEELTIAGGSGANAWSIRKEILHGGTQEGVDRVTVNNGKLSFTVIPTRGMDIWDARCEDVKLAWKSPVTEVVHPQYVNLDERGGLGWLLGFGAWMCRCGLASNGAPGEDQVTTNTGAIATTQLSLHGKISYLPARYVEVEVDHSVSPGRLVVRGVVDETMMYGTQLRMLTEISTTLGSPSLTIVDKVVNLASRPQEFQMLYHTNFGDNLLEEGSTVVAPVQRVTPRDKRAAEGGVENWHKYAGPTDGYTEQVYFLRLFGDEKDQTEIMLKNAKGDRGASLTFSTRELPCTTIWKNTAGANDGYVTGLEPGTNFPNNRMFERRNGRVVNLRPGQSYPMKVTFTAHTSAEAVAAAEKRIQALAKSRPPQVDAEPKPDVSP